MAIQKIRLNSIGGSTPMGLNHKVIRCWILICLTVWFFFLSHLSILPFSGSFLGWRQQKQITDVTDYAGPHSPGWSPGAQSFRGSSANNLPFSPSQVNATPILSQPAAETSPGIVQFLQRKNLYHRDRCRIFSLAVWKRDSLE